MLRDGRESDEEQCSTRSVREAIEGGPKVAEAPMCQTGRRREDGAQSELVRAAMAGASGLSWLMVGRYGARRWWSQDGETEQQ